jgi:hypothetical protein
MAAADQLDGRNDTGLDFIMTDANAAIWLDKYGIQKAWILRHIPAPWDKSIRISPLAIAAFENNVPMVILTAVVLAFVNMY